MDLQEVSRVVRPMAGTSMDTDVLIVGAGPAGLTAATYLGRFLRRVVVADGGPPRASWIPLSHNMPAFPEGADGATILTRMRDQAERYGAEIRPGRIRKLALADGGFVGCPEDGGEVRARAVLLATGVEDRRPPLPGVERAIERGVVRICPICDAYEATDKAIAVIGDGEKGARECAFLRTYSDRVALIHVGAPEDLPRRAELEGLGVEVIETAFDGVEIEGDRVTALSWAGQARTFDVLYSALGTDANVKLAVQLGAERSEDGRLVVTDHNETSVPGLYAAGDVVLGLNQIAVATAEAAIAATDIHNRLCRADGMRL